MGVHVALRSSPPTRGSTHMKLGLLSLLLVCNPFREQGPPANMAKLILLRHKIQTTNRKRRPSQSRQAVRACNIQALSRQQSSPWMRFGKAFGAKQYH
ncbi:hypothetical protein B0H16DRAFT_1710775 [Mycena metata]|uniref:Uncharacterized protein n=1 Tax=Mycena metata TaxID=1033252 RepID=A0AAD7KC16_9AGAR|nr:hypothetical protein B0H16DRAFT_1710775 [Mycena metata]